MIKGRVLLAAVDHLSQLPAWHLYFGKLSRVRPRPENKAILQKSPKVE